MIPVNDPPVRQSRKAAVALTAMVGVLTTVVAYLGTREAPPLAPTPEPAPAAPAAFPTVLTIVLPHADPDLPPGPHQKAFVSACTVCHSTQLVLNQPPFPRAKWTEIVRKMTKVYGAPFPPQDEPQIVDYLVAIRGQ